MQPAEHSASAPRVSEAGDTPTRKTLLLVDDEPHVVNGLKRILRSDGYTIHVANDAEEALDLLREHAIHVIVSDQNMPGKKGTDFLREASQLHPRTVRMLLSGAAEVQEVADAMGEGVIYKYLTKPIDPILLRANVKEAFCRANDAALAAIHGEQPGSVAEQEPDRGAFERAFGRFVERAQQAQLEACLLMLIVDQYEGVVSSYGRSFCEPFIAAVKSRILAALSDGDYLAKDAPGKFMVLAAARDSEERIAQIGNALKQQFNEPMQVGDRSLSVTLSIGAAVADASHTVEDLVDQAQVAMAAGKAKDKTIQIFRPELIAAVREQLELESDLRAAVKEERFELHYQPQVDIETGAIAGLEALLRWKHVRQGYVSPTEFIPVAEKCGLIEQIGEWVLATAIEQTASWTRDGRSVPSVAINVSPKQLKQAQFAEKVATALRNADMQPGKLVLEITESAAIGRSEDVSACLMALRDIGVSLAIDDFGSGYANHGNLYRFVFDKLKLDRSLLPRNLQDKRRMRIYSNIIELAHQLNLTTIAEGVETPGELAAVYGAGCRLVQGYFYSPALAADELQDYFECGIG